MSIVNKIIQDYRTAVDNHEQYQRCQGFFKGSNSEPMAVIEFMTFDYLPDKLKRFVTWHTNIFNKFFNWWMNFHRLSFLTLLMLCAIVYIVFNI